MGTRHDSLSFQDVLKRQWSEMFSIEVFGNNYNPLQEAYHPHPGVPLHLHPLHLECYRNIKGNMKANLQCQSNDTIWRQQLHIWPLFCLLSPINLYRAIIQISSLTTTSPDCSRIKMHFCKNWINTKKQQCFMPYFFHLCSNFVLESTPHHCHCHLTILTAMEFPLHVDPCLSFHKIAWHPF